MTRFFEFAAQTPTLITSFLAMMVLGAAFGPLQEMAMNGISLLDLTTDPDQARTLLASMSPEIKQTHFISTLTLDTAYPLSILTLFAGLTYRFGPQAIAGHLCYVPVAATLSDFAENTLILASLSGYDLIEWKSMMTSIKFPMFFVAGAIALFCILYGLGRRVFGRQ